MLHSIAANDCSPLSPQPLHSTPALSEEIEKSRGRAPQPPVEEQRRRLSAVRELLAENSLDGLLVYGSAETKPEPIRYLAGYVHVFPSACSLLLIPRHEAASILLIDQAWHLDEARKMSWIGDVRAMPNGARRWRADELRASLGAALDDGGLASGRIGIFDAAMPSVYSDALTASRPEVQLTDATEVWDELVGSPSEYDREMVLRTAAIADEGLAAVSASAGEGVFEYDVCINALRRMASLGAEFLHGSGVSTHINIGSHSELISNVRPFLFSGNRLEAGQMFWVDLTASYAGYYIDCDRTISVGDPSGPQQELYDITAAMYSAMLNEARAGIAGGEFWEVGNAVAQEAGRADSSNHVYLGHTTGAATSQRPVVAPGEDKPLRDGSFVNIEPGIFVPGLGSACIENTLAIRADGADAINRFGIEMQIV